jgi:hypothetical protein
MNSTRWCYQYEQNHGRIHRQIPSTWRIHSYQTTDQKHSMILNTATGRVWVLVIPTELKIQLKPNSPTDARSSCPNLESNQIRPTLKRCCFIGRSPQNELFKKPPATPANRSNPLWQKRSQEGKTAGTSSRAQPTWELAQDWSKIPHVSDPIPGQWQLTGLTKMKGGHKKKVLNTEKEIRSNHPRRLEFWDKRHLDIFLNSYFILFQNWSLRFIHQGRTYPVICT